MNECRRSVSRLKLLLALLSVFLVGAVQASAVLASSSQGSKYILSSCCTLLGTRDTITLPSSSSWSDGHASCIGMYSDAVSGGPIWIQDGPLKCYNGATIDGTCSGGPISYVEVKNSGVAAQCTNEGSIAWSSTHLYTVDSTSTNIWAAYIDGSSPPVYPGKLTMGPSAQIDETAEYAVGGCSDGFSAAASFSVGSPVWQRWTGSTWFTVQGSNNAYSCGWSYSGSIANGWSDVH